MPRNPWIVLGRSTCGLYIPFETPCRCTSEMHSGDISALGDPFITGCPPDTSVRVAAARCTRILPEMPQRTQHTHLAVELPQAPPLSRGRALQIDHIALFEAQLLLAWAGHQGFRASEGSSNDISIQGDRLCPEFPVRLWFYPMISSRSAAKRTRLSA